MSGFYKAYDLIIKSEVALPLPALQAIDHYDVSFIYGRTPEIVKYCSWDGVFYDYFNGYREQALGLKWTVVGSYLISNGREVFINPNESSSTEDTLQPLLGTIMAVALQQRGSLVLHGSAVLEGDRVILFIGGKGMGKSTLAAWLNEGGRPLLSDDICAIDVETDRGMVVRPGFPTIKLYPEVIQYLGFDPENYQRVHSTYDKRLGTVENNFCSSAMPIASICSLAFGDEIRCTPLEGMDAVKEILTHMIINRFPEAQPMELQEEIFRQTAQITKTTPIYQITRPKDLARLQDVSQVLLNTVKW